MSRHAFTLHATDARTVYWPRNSIPRDANFAARGFDLNLPVLAFYSFPNQQQILLDTSNFRAILDPPCHLIDEVIVSDMPTIYQNWLATISGTIKEKWTVIPALLMPAVIGTFITTSAWRAYSDAHAPKVVVDRAMRVEAIDTLVAKLNDHYVSSDKAKQIEAVLRQRQQDGKYDGMTDGEQLAKQLTADLLGVAHDLHMKVVFSRWLVRSDNAISPRPASRPRSVETVYRLPATSATCGCAGFPPPDLVAEKYAAAMDRLADTDGLIVDLRENRGGDAQTVALLISYFVDRRTRLTDIWDRDTGTTTKQWTRKISLTANAMAARSRSSFSPARVRRPPAKTSPIRCRQ